MIALDYACLFQPPDASQAGTLRKRDPLCECGVGDASRRLQRAQDPTINSIQRKGGSSCSCKDRRIFGFRQGLRHHLWTAGAYSSFGSRSNDMANEYTDAADRNDNVWAAVFAATLIIGLPAIMLMSNIISS